MRLGQRVYAVIAMQRLRRLAGSDFDRHRSAELVVPEHLVEYSEHQRMRRRTVEDPRLREQRIDAACLKSFERVAPSRRRRQQIGQLGPHLACLLLTEQTFDDRVTIGVELAED